MTLVAAHQPTFLPWLGWWDKLNRSDVLVLLDDVQYPKTGSGTWINRVRLLISGEPRWITVPVDRRFHGTRTVREMRIDASQSWREKIVRTISTNYRRAPYFSRVMPVVEAALADSHELLAELNESTVRRFAEHLGIDVSRLIRQSELAVGGTSNELLVGLCRAVGGDTYLSGDGAGDYLSEQAFADAGLQLRYQGFTPPPYPQPVPQHVAGLSVVDALMNCGWKGTADLLRQR